MKLETLFSSIAFRISVSVAVIIALTSMAVGWLILNEERKTLETELKNKGRYLAELMSHHLVEPLLYEEIYALHSLLEGSMKSNDSLVVYGEVHDKNGELLVTAFKSEKWKSMKMPVYSFDNAGKDVLIQEDNYLPVYHVIVPIIAEPLGTIGFLRLSITKELLYSTIKDVQKKLYVMSTAIIVAGILL